MAVIPDWPLYVCAAIVALGPVGLYLARDDVWTSLPFGALGLLVLQYPMAFLASEWRWSWLLTAFATLAVLLGIAALRLVTRRGRSPERIVGGVSGVLVGVFALELGGVAVLRGILASAT